MKRFLFILVVVGLAVGAWAEECVKIVDLYYTLNSKSRTAEVVPVLPTIKNMARNSLPA